eukprot:TRINITY_DN662_c0_g2_i2.p2 TRINITY_DN662_c0_g2~~TRINITY_DN662_c0_g2_i2.p2  ORF type:complete len:129 (+),score=35.97 TRINITY_DN662_c0_g2_i2:22-387(+)
MEQIARAGIPLRIKNTFKPKDQGTLIEPVIKEHKEGKGSSGINAEYGSKEVPKFEGSVLVLPSLAVGNVGQLAIDTLINTSSLPRVGYIDSPFILPMIANDAFDSEEGCLVTCVEGLSFSG